MGYASPKQTKCRQRLEIIYPTNMHHFSFSLPSPLPPPLPSPLLPPYAHNTEYVCHEAGGASVLAYSQLKQRMFSGGKRGAVCIFDIRQNALIQCLPVFTSSITCMEVNDIDGYIVTGSAEGDIKVCWGEDFNGGSTEGDIKVCWGDFNVEVN